MCYIKELKYRLVLVFQKRGDKPMAWLLGGARVTGCANNCVSLPQNNLAKAIAIIGKEIYCNDAFLDDEHLLQIVNLALNLRMVVNRLNEISLMGQKPELKR